MVKRSKSALLLLATALAALAWLVPVGAANNDPFTGTWKINLQRSKLVPPLPKSQTVTIQASAEEIHVREEVVMADGQMLTVTVDAKFDGRDYPVNGSPVADQIAYQRVNARTIKGTAKKAGRVILRETATVSRDGRTLTGQYSGTGADGKKIIGTAVFDRQ